MMEEGPEDGPVNSSPKSKKLSRRKDSERDSKEMKPLIDTPEIPYPKSVFFIIVTEFCERFSYTGMRTILTLYLRNVLLRSYKNSEDLATMIYHAFVSLCYFTPLLGGIIADSFLGKYKTILYISFIYAIGNCVLSLAAVTPLHLPQLPMSLLGLALIGFGTGGIKPCVNAFGGDQFKLPEQTRQLHQFFFFFYFAINSGSLMSTFVTPIMRRDVSCFGHDTCYSLAFGAPAIFWILAIIIFMLGKRYYIIKNPEGNVAVQVGGCIWYAVVTKSGTGHKKGAHWLDRANDKYSPSFIEDVKVLFRILVLFIPLPIYWALYEQQGSTWTLQATRMKGYMTNFWTLKPDQMQACNSFLILFYIPLFERIIYPLLEKCNILTTSLQRMTLGCFMLSIAFVLAGVVELNLEPTYPVIPAHNETALQFINALPCPITVTMKDEESDNPTPRTYTYQPYADYTYPDLPASTYKISTRLWIMAGECPMSINQTYFTFKARGGKAYTTLISTDSAGGISLDFSENDLRKSREGNAKLKVMYSMTNPDSTLELNSMDSSENLKFDFKKGSGGSTATQEVEPKMYEILLHEPKHTNRLQAVLLDEGGNYILAIFPHSTGTVVDLDNSVAMKVFVLTKPNSIHMLYLLPQYFVLTLAELFFSITGFTFSYTQAPARLKAVIQSLWLLTIGLGSLLVIVITSLDLFDRPAVQFLSYSVLMVFGAVIFIILASRYKPNDTGYTRLEDDTEPAEFVMEPEDIRTLAIDLVS